MREATEETCLKKTAKKERAKDGGEKLNKERGYVDQAGVQISSVGKKQHIGRAIKRAEWEHQDMRVGKQSKLCSNKERVRWKCSKELEYEGLLSRKLCWENPGSNGCGQYKERSEIG